MPRLILGLHVGHNASACIGAKEGVIYAVQEERLNGEKNYWGFPSRAIEACLEKVGASRRDLEVIAVGSRQSVARYHDREGVLEAFRRQERPIGWLRQRLGVPIGMAVMKRFGQRSVLSSLQAQGLGDVPVEFHEHHAAHAATAFWGLRRDPAQRLLVMTCDGVGDGVSATVRVMGPGEERVLAVTRGADSLGGLYSAATYALGFVPLEHEYKLMGMAPYAPEDVGKKMAKRFRQHLDLEEGGLSFRRNGLTRTGDLHLRLHEGLRATRMDHFCAGLQTFTEELLCEWVANAVRKTGAAEVVAAGGVFMNVKANLRITELPEVSSFQAFPSCGDETLCFGAFYREASARYGDESVGRLDHCYLGDDVEVEDAEAEVAASGFSYRRPVDMAEAIADLLAGGQPVARCAGRMEFGARALGNRSILADPSQADVVRVINQMVKKRDFWMPFAPLLMEGDQHEYLENPKGVESPYMMMTFRTRENFRDLIAAVHQADLTCRAQVLKSGQNPEVERILGAFAAKTGRRVILNTSFNLHGFPIVRTASEALAVLRESGLAHLQVGPFLVSKAR